jgi:subtilisin family serine protease
MRIRWIAPSFFAAALILALACAGAAEVPPNGDVVVNAPKVSPWVLDKVAAEGKAEFIVLLAEQADLRGASRLETKAEKGAYVYKALTATASRSQGPLIKVLRALGVEYQPFWVANMIRVRGDSATLSLLAQRPDVARIHANPSVRLPEPLRESARRAPLTPMAIEWNISHVNAPAVWAAGFTGQGAVVGGQDTGYQWDHPALKSQYRGWDGVIANHDYAWHDAIHAGSGPCGGDSPAPCDDYGHGTHTMGTMVGDDGVGNQIGMAPGARWIGCRNMNQGNGTPITYSECYQWFIAPTKVDGTDPDPAMAPDVINNSWGCTPAEGCAATDPNVLLTVVKHVRAAGIVTVHSAGNEGPACSTVAEPASIYGPSFAVGATDSSDAIADFSSRGPVTVDGSGRSKPDISAPGVSIRSSVPSSIYQAGWSGTSMAAPHVAGLCALVISANPALAGRPSAVESILEKTTLPLPSSEGCGGDGPTDVPNNTYGWGRIDSLAAYEAATTGSLTVRITPAEVKGAGARWKIKGDLWRKSGRTVSGLPPGPYTVVFKAIDGWSKPAAKTVVVKAAQGRVVKGRYIRADSRNPND